jgi:hypothetical protein
MPKTYLLVLALCLLMTGCAPVDSLNPLYNDKDVVFDPSLLGDWVSPDPTEKGVTTFVELTEFGSKLQGYDITMTGEDGSAKFHAHLVNLGGQRVLDVVPQSWDASSDSYTLQLNQTKNGTALEPRLLRLAMAAYMEFTGPKDGKIQARLIPAHWFFKVATDGKKLRLDYIDDEKLSKAIVQGDVHIRHSLLGEGKNKDIVVTAGTPELQQFVAQYLNDGKIFTEHTEMVRRP